ncbi:hypothetical protein PXD04_11415 (plasmid) [Methanosphaera sp. ISO3-F5]|uniref:hypothetical protein n=1 Tax=Methanosphaera sp. ISO3-F5 TaxID=1452353 RepID=UPI002B262048|nr:hypothetical protein [Methanosphaera sp. ISO3-F5]WQH65350.1 hypothetical protein PXD04_11415 [Methanosphaera sp. ISO3-F5]
MPRMTFYLDEKNAESLKELENKSRIVNEALRMYFLNKEVLVKKQVKIENNIRELEAQLENERAVLANVMDEIMNIENNDNIRPENYLKTVSILRTLPDVQEEDLIFQAERLNVSVIQLKRWLCMDGFMEDILEDCVE